MRREPTANRRGSTVELPSHSGAANGLPDAAQYGVGIR